MLDGRSIYKSRGSSWQIYSWLFIVALVLWLTNSVQAVYCKEKTDARWQVPLLYLTDRNAEKPDYGSRRKYVIDCKHDMYYGVADVVVADYNNKKDQRLADQLGWTRDPKANVDSVHCEQIEGADPHEIKKKFFDRLTAMLDKSGDNKLCLFVHGAAEGFDDAALDAAALAYSLEYPLVFYSWPSVPKLLGYNVDGGNNEYSQAHFNTFLRDLLDYHKEHPLELIIVSHSMGNRLVIRAAHLLYRSGLVKDAELVSPDIDAETFKHYILGMEAEHAIIRIYTSNRDKMLPLSQMFYGGYYRLGEGVGAMFSGLKKTDDNSGSSSSGEQTDVGTDGKTGKSDVSAASKPSARSADSTAIAKAYSDDEPTSMLARDIVNVPSGKAMSEKSRGLAERIDFTAVDEGFRGHSIPFDMLASMIRTDTPGMGLALAPANPGKGSNLARFMRWSHHLGKVDDHGDSDLCKRIVKVLHERTAK